jgi:dynein heavy chain
VSPNQYVFCFSTQVGDHEVECQPSFRLYLHTTDEPHDVPSELAAHLAIILFQGSRRCVEEELLDRFMKKEKPRLEEERILLLHVSDSHAEVWKTGNELP